MQRSAFLYLLKRELKWNRNTTKKNKWKYVYIFLGLAIGITFYTIVLRKGYFEPQYLWYFTFAYPFILMGLLFGTIANEWKNRTYGWWLSLPYPREKLLQTKLLAIWIQVLQVFIFTILTVFISSLYGSYVSDSISLETVLQYFLNGLIWLGILTLYYPVVANLSIMTFLSSHTRYKVFTPLLWIVLIVTVNIAFWFFSKTGEPWMIRFTSSTIIFLLISWIIAWVIFKTCARWLEKELEL